MVKNKDEDNEWKKEISYMSIKDLLKYFKINLHLIKVWELKQDVIVYHTKHRLW